MKNLFTSFLMLFFICNLFAQYNVGVINKLNFAVSLSSVKGNNLPQYAIDDQQGNGQRAETELEDNPWLDVDMEAGYKIQGIRLWHYSPIEGYYIFISKVPFYSSDIADLLADNSVEYFHVTTDAYAGQIITIPETLGRYVRIQKTGTGVLALEEIDIIGIDLIFLEICNDGVDNDFDGFTDCDDYSCKVSSFSVFPHKPTCAYCNDGKICVRATNADHISIDGGITWYPHNGNGLKCFDNLPEGEYAVVATKGQCPVEMERINLSAPRGIHGDCFNGGFEEGDFTGWTGGQTFNADGSPVFSNLTIAEPRHKIFPTATFQDPIVTAIDGQYPALGMFVARLGSIDLDGSMPESGTAERLTYCLDIDANNQDLYFIYALVLENPDDAAHQEINKPFFQYKVFPSNNPTNVIAEDKTISNDPFLITDNNGIKYKGWTCVNLDLSTFIGQEVCIEFIASDCSFGGHYGYAYIDGLCSSLEDVTPLVSLSGNDVTCSNQVITVEAMGGGYTQYEWRIAKIDAFGNEYEIVTLDQTIGYEAILEDVESIYEANSNFKIDCPQDIRVTFTAINDCATAEDSRDYSLICGAYEVDYCDYLIVCNAEQQPMILGTNNCNNCNVIWTPGQFFTDPTAQFPIIDRTRWTDVVLEQSYSVEVLTPEGCLYTDQVAVDFSDGYEISFEKTIDYCSYTVDIILDFLVDVQTSVINVYLQDRNTDEIFSVNFVEENADGQKFFVGEISRESDTDLEIVVEIDYSQANGFDEDCLYGNEFCSKRMKIFPVAASPFFNPWRMYIPLNISPNGNGINDEWRPYIASFSSPQTNVCDETTVTEETSIYSLELKIFHRQGGLVFESTQVAGVNGPGLTGAEIAWDGTVNGTPLNPGVFVYTLTVKSCWEVTNGNPPCVCDDETEHCGTTGETLIAGDITLTL